MAASHSIPQQRHTHRRKGKHYPFLKPTLPTRAIPPPRIHADHYVTVFRPLNGLYIHDWTNQELSQALIQASVIPEEQFQALITTQVQPINNLFVIGPPDPYVADRLSQLTSIPLRNAHYDITAYMKSPPGTWCHPRSAGRHHPGEATGIHRQQSPVPYPREANWSHQICPSHVQRHTHPILCKSEL